MYGSEVPISYSFLLVGCFKVAKGLTQLSGIDYCLQKYSETVTKVLNISILLGICAWHKVATPWIFFPNAIPLVLGCNLVAV